MTIPNTSTGAPDIMLTPDIIIPEDTFTRRIGSVARSRLASD